MKNLKQIRMIKTMSIAAFGILLTICFMTGCTKKKQGCTNPEALNYNAAAEEDDGSCVLAGKPGYTTLKAHAMHHDTSIFSSPNYRDSVFIKYNTIEFPGDNPSLYDEVIKGDKDVDYVTVKGLREGHYYIYMTGWDASIGARVTGGMPYTLTLFTGILDLNIPVTE